MSGSSFKYLLKEGVKNIWSNRMMSLASVAVLVCCLVLTGAALLLSMNVGNAMKSLENTNSVQVYLEDDLSTLQGIQVGEEIKKLDNVATCEFIPKDEAIQRYVDMLDGEGEILNGLTGEDNPLPNAFRVSFEDLSIYKQTAEEIKSIKGVMKINDYSSIAKTLTTMDRVILYGGIGAVAFLAIVSLLIIVNTIRVTMHSRQLEISIMKSVGATNTFIRIPFLIEAMILGLLSGAIACAIVLPLYQGVASTVSRLLTFFQPIPLESIFWWVIGGALIIGILFGLCAGVISIGKYLRREGGDTVD
ncbi:MAG: permease-like cell division protein FtsX [Oscillospiraceae bacterium]|nr:permease-like cell division protein FtsX [Oscillospiraceae bacterium]